jgi:hypothetical protein
VERTPVTGGKGKQEVEVEDASFWPGGRVQLCGDDIEAEARRVRAWDGPTEKQKQETEGYMAFMNDFTEDP